MSSIVRSTRVRSSLLISTLALVAASAAFTANAGARAAADVPPSRWFDVRVAITYARTWSANTTFTRSNGSCALRFVVRGSGRTTERHVGDWSLHSGANGSAFPYGRFYAADGTGVPRANVSISDSGSASVTATARDPAAECGPPARQAADASGCGSRTLHNVVEHRRDDGSVAAFQFLENTRSPSGRLPVALSDPPTFGVLNAVTPTAFDLLDEVPTPGPCPLAWGDTLNGPNGPLGVCCRDISGPSVHGTSDVTAAGIASGRILHEHWVYSSAMPVQLVDFFGPPRNVGIATDTETFDVLYCPKDRRGCGSRSP